MPDAAQRVLPLFRDGDSDSETEKRVNVVRKHVDAVGRDASRRRYWIRRATQIIGKNGDPEDVLSKAFERALISAHTYKPEFDFDPWFASIIRSVAWRASSNYVRIEQREVSIPDMATGGYDDAQSFEAWAESRVQEQAIEVRETEQWQIAIAALKSLPRPECELLTMYYLERIPIAEIAAVYGRREGRHVTKTAITVRLQRARTALREAATNDQYLVN